MSMQPNARRSWAWRGKEERQHLELQWRAQHSKISVLSRRNPKSISESSIIKRVNIEVTASPGFNHSILSCESGEGKGNEKVMHE